MTVVRMLPTARTRPGVLDVVVAALSVCRERDEDSQTSMRDRRLYEGHRRPLATETLNLVGKRLLALLEPDRMRLERSARDIVSEAGWIPAWASAAEAFERAGATAEQRRDAAAVIAAAPFWHRSGVLCLREGDTIADRRMVVRSTRETGGRWPKLLVVLTDCLTGLRCKTFSAPDSGFAQLVRQLDIGAGVTINARVSNPSDVYGSTVSVRLSHVRGTVTQPAAPAAPATPATPAAPAAPATPAPAPAGSALARERRSVPAADSYEDAVRARFGALELD